MTQTKTSKRALLTSALSLLLCCTMLIGTTWAWFTDSVTSAGNKIQSGTLKVDLLVKGGNTGVGLDDDYESVKTGTLANQPIFDYELWEPGYTLVTYAKVVNEGSLALKYTLKFVSESDIAAEKLAEVIDVYYVADEVAIADRTALADVQTVGTLKEVFEQGADVVMNDNLLPNGEDKATIVLKMKEEAGNEYQNQTIPAFDIQLLATQWTYENDSFDNKYDENAEYPTVPLSFKIGAHEYAGSPEFINSIKSKLNSETNTVPHTADNKLVAEINTADDMVALSQMMQDGTVPGWADPEIAHRIININDDIDMSGKDFTPFNGMCFDIEGNNHTISNLNNSLYGYLCGGKIKDLTIKDSNVTGDCVGLFAYATEDSTLENVKVEGKNTVTFDNSKATQGGSHKGVGVLAGLTFGTKYTATIADGANVEVNYNDIEFNWNNNYYPVTVDTYYGGVAKGKPQSADSSVNDNGTVTTNGSYTVYVKKTTMSVGGADMTVTQAFADSITKNSGGLVKTATLSSADDFKALSAMMKNGMVASFEGNSATINLAADIDLAGVEVEPLSLSQSVFDGQNHTIRNLNAVQGSVIGMPGGKSGLFSYAGGMNIKNLTLENVTVSGCQAGAFAGQAEDCRLENCTLAGNVKITWSECTCREEDCNAVGAVIGWTTAGTTLNNVKIADNTSITLVKDGMAEKNCDDANNLQGTKYFVGAGVNPDTKSESVIVGTNVTVNGIATP